MQNPKSLMRNSMFSLTFSGDISSVPQNHLYRGQYLSSGFPTDTTSPSWMTTLVIPMASKTCLPWFVVVAPKYTNFR